MGLLTLRYVLQALAENERILASKTSRILREAKQEEDARQILRLHTQRFEQELKQRYTHY
jgi:hypothetical protein